MLFSQSEMIYKDYYWEFRYLPRSRHTDGQLDDTVFTRSEAPQMLYFLNKYAELQNWQHHLHNRLQKLELSSAKQFLKACQCEVKEWPDKNIRQLWLIIIVIFPEHFSY